MLHDERMDRLDIEYIRIEIDSYTDNENGKRRMKENCNSANPYEENLLRFREGSVQYCGRALKRRKSAFCLCFSESDIKIMILDYLPCRSLKRVRLSSIDRSLDRILLLFLFFFDNCEDKFLVKAENFAR